MEMFDTNNLNNKNRSYNFKLGPKLRDQAPLTEKFYLKFYYQNFFQYLEQSNYLCFFFLIHLTDFQK